MSNALAIAAVTATIRYLLEEALSGDQPGPVGGAVVTTLRPDQITSGGGPGGQSGLNVFLHQVTPNHAYNLTDLPTRDRRGRLVAQPIAAIDLHYLISCYGNDAALESQRLLARAVLALTVTPVLVKAVVEAMVARFEDDPDLSVLTESDLALQVEPVKLAPTVLSMEDMSRLWGVLGSPYLLSVTYLATVVVLKPIVAPHPVLPVRRRGIGVLPRLRPRLDRVDTVPAGEAVGTGSQLVLAGSGLLGSPLPGEDPVTTLVRIGSAELSPEFGADAGRPQVVVGPEVPAGVKPIQVVHRTKHGDRPVERTTNALAVVVRPAVTVTGVDPTAVRLALTPALRKGQNAVAILDPVADGGAPDGPLEFALPVGEDPVTDVELPRADIPDGTWRVQVRVDGVDSLPTPSGPDGEYLGPQVSLP